MSGCSFPENCSRRATSARDTEWRDGNYHSLCRRYFGTCSPPFATTRPERTAGWEKSYHLVLGQFLTGAIEQLAQSRVAFGFFHAPAQGDEVIDLRFVFQLT